MKKFLYIVLLFVLFLVGILSSCNGESANKSTDEIIVTPTLTPNPIIDEISMSPVAFVFLENEQYTYNSLYHQLAYIRMEGLGYNISNMYVKGTDDIQSVLSQLEVNGTEYVVITSNMLNEQAKAYQDTNNSNMVFIQHGDYYMDSILSYQVKLYEYYYLAGVALCSESITKVAGFIADSPDEQTIRCINAFALGMKSVDSDAVVIVNWTTTTDDENIVSQMIDNLSNQKCDVFSYFMPGDLVDKVCGKMGLNYMSMSTHTVINSDAKMSIKPVINLDSFYASIINSDKSSLVNEFNYLGVKSKIVSYEISTSVTDDTNNAVESAYNNLLEDYDVFSGPIYNELGLVIPEGTTLPEEDILHMLWFVDNVVGELPAG